MAWGASGGVEDVLLRTLEGVADTVTGRTIDACGHYIPEEAPDIVIRQLTDFFADGTDC